MLFNNFPREIGPPRKVVCDTKEFLKYVNLNNGMKKALYTSTYMFKDIDENWKPDYSSAIVDKIYFDFDDKSCNAYDECNKLHKECMKENLKHIIIFSGRGYHIYIFTIEGNLQHKKEAIRGGQEYFISKLKLTVDRQVIGNVAQMGRIPNTYHPKARRFCIPLTKEQFEKGDGVIKQLAEKQNFVRNIIIGEKLFDISKWDIKSETDYFDLDLPKSTSKSFNSSALTKDIPVCISKLMEDENCGWKGRYLIILYFKEKGFLIDEVSEILRGFLSQRKLYHCIKEERQLQYLFSRDDLMFPSCSNLMKDKICPKKCELYENVIYR